MAANPSWSEVWTQIRASVKLLRETFNFGSQNSDNLVDLVDGVLADAKGAHAPRMVQAARTIRAGVADALGRGRELIDPCVLELGRIIDSPKSSIAGILDDLADYMQANSLSVVTRDITRGSVAAPGSNVGDGTVYALTVNENNVAIEAGGPFVTALECTADTNTGTLSGAAVFDVFTDGAPPADALVSGDGLARRLNVRARAAADGLLGNPSFRSYNSAATHPFSPWLVSGSSPSYSGITQSSSGARPDRGTTTPANPLGTATSLKLDGNNLAVYQIVPQQLDPDRPVALVAWYKPVSCDGNLYLKLGSRSVSVALSGASGWSRLAMATTADCWYSQFRDTPLTVQAWLQDRSAGYVLIDEVLLAPMDYYNGRWFVVVPGQSDFEVGDRFTFSDASANDLNIQGWIDRLYGAWMPHASGGAATIADPA
ncbi:MAG: hypothetical protein AB7K09_17935 [Planctomycetota bacterium]